MSQKLRTAWMAPFAPRAWAGLLLLAVAAGAAAAESPPAPEWIARYSGNGIGNSQVNAMAMDAHANVYITGNTSGSWWDIATVKYDSTGAQVWATRYNGPAGGDDVSQAIAVDAGGNVYVAGYTDGNGEYNYDVLTIKYNAAGVQQWARTYAGAGNGGLDEASGVAVDANGNVYVTGFSFEPAGGNDVVTIKYDASGTQKWVQRYDGPAHSDDGGNAIILDADANVYVTGVSQLSPSGGNYDVVTIKYDTAGAQQWVQRYNGPTNANDGGIALALDPSRNLYVTGYTTGAARRFDMLTIKYGPTGSQQWVRTYDDPGSGYDAALAIAVDADGNSYVTGYAEQPGHQSDYATIKYDTAGTQLWTAFYDGPVSGYDEGQAIALDADRNVYVTGYSDGGTGMVNYDYATLKYDNAGQPQWVVRYNGPGDNIDVAKGIGVDAAGDVFVSGWSTGTNNTNVDFATIKYVQQTPAGIDASGADTGRGPLLARVFPNPCRDDARIRFTLRRAGRVDIGVWSASGRRVRTLLDEWRAAGPQDASVTVATLPAGTYTYRITAAGEQATGKLVRIR